MKKSASVGRSMKLDSGNYENKGSPLSFHAYAQVFSPIPDDHPLLAKIGLVVVEWTRVEHILDFIILDIAKIDLTGKSSLTGWIHGVKQRFVFIEFLAQFREISRETLKEIADLKKAAKEPSDQRNAVVHNYWAVERDTGKPAQRKSMVWKHDDRDFKDVTEDELDQTIATIRDYAKKVAELREMIVAEIKTPKPPWAGSASLSGKAS